MTDKQTMEQIRDMLENGYDIVLEKDDLEYTAQIGWKAGGRFYTEGFDSAALGKAVDAAYWFTKERE